MFGNLAQFHRRGYAPGEVQLLVFVRLRVLRHVDYFLSDLLFPRLRYLLGCLVFLVCSPDGSSSSER